jgi:hypothetical protein
VLTSCCALSDAGLGQFINDVISAIQGLVDRRYRGVELDGLNGE